MEEENFKYDPSNEGTFSDDLYLEMGTRSIESSLESNFQEQYSSDNNYNFDPAQFDNTYIQQITPITFSEKVFPERNSYDSYLTNYSTPSSMSNISQDGDAYPIYHFTNASQYAMSSAANLINNSDDLNSISKAKSLNSKSESNDKLYDMMNKIVEENSNLKKKLDFFQRFMRGPQSFAEEQNGIF